MNTTALKRFAQEARRKLLMQVGARLELVLNTDSAELREKAQSLRRLREEISASSKQQVVDKVAYTWFNRFIALRFMDVKDYQPLGLRMVTPREGYTLPEVLHEAKQGHIPEELPVNRRHIQDLLDGRIPAANAQNEAYKELLIGACNHLHQVFPFMFERINDYTELLLPDDLTSGFSIVHDIREGMQAADCAEVEIIGWLYQFYISERKDEVIASKEKVKKEDIPAATQLFTPRWIVEYMVQNTLGKLWLQNRPHSKLRQHMPYYIESASLEAVDYLQIQSPEEIKFLDPASGSGHILVYAFDLFTKIYEEEGYNTSEIPQFIIRNNLYGFEIDERAAQLSALALMMKAQAYDRSVFRKEIKPNILCFQDLHVTKDEIKELADYAQAQISNELMHDLLLMQQATNFGSLIIPHAQIIELETFLDIFTQFLPKADVFQRSNIVLLIDSARQLQMLCQKFHCVVANPPYMGNGSMNAVLSNFVKENYPDSKADLMTCFMENAQRQLILNGILGMINLPSWMFLSSFEKYRKELLVAFKIETLLHLGRGVFGSDFGTVAFTFRKTNVIEGEGVFRRLFEKHVQVRSVEKIRKLFLDKNYGCYYANQKAFEKIPGSPIGYWFSPKLTELFANLKPLRYYSDVKVGMSTANNSRYIRTWHEISTELFSMKDGARWFPLNNGGNFRKWFGNREDVVIWENDGEIIKNTGNPTIRNSRYYLKPGLSGTSISSKSFNVRYFDSGFLFTTAGFCAFPSETSTWSICALLNSKVSSKLLSLLSPTMNFNVGDIANVPITLIEQSNELAKDCISVSKNDWDSHETSWDFLQNELLRLSRQSPPTTHHPLLTLYQNYKTHWSAQFFQLHQNEEELNKQFIEIYGLQEELTPDVPLEEITILQQELDRGALAKLSKKYKSGWWLVDGEWKKVGGGWWMVDGKEQPTTNHHPPSTNHQPPSTNHQPPDLPFDAKEIMSQLISYAVGCMFGRYSLDKEGLILANQGETVADYVKKVAGDWWTVDGNGNWVFNQEIYDDEHRKKLQGVADMAASHGTDQTYIHFAAGNAQGRIVWPDESDQKGSSERTEQHSRGSGEGNQGVYPFSDDSQRIPGRTGNTTDSAQGAGNDETRADNTPYGVHRKPGQANQQPDQQTPLTTTHHPPPTNHHPPITFMPDDDNIIPILDEEWFEDDIVNRFHQFLKVAFGEEHFSKNLAFLEDSLGKDIRKYFLRDFYPDHIRRYKKRPIYWMFSSPKGTFNVLIYMHRYTPDTINLILNKYLRQLQEKMKHQLDHLNHVLDTGSAAEQNKATREKDRLRNLLLELQEYEREVIYPLATERIPIDLDDGVLVNYNKFGRALKEVAGLNDKKTKEKVRGFDWIDTGLIR